MNKQNIVLVVALCLFQSVATNTTANESINPFLIYGGAPSERLAQSVPILAEYDLLVMSRGHHHRVNGNTWGAIKAISPGTKIFLYQGGPWVADNDDATPVSELNNLGRYNVSRGSSEGSINDHPGWFLKNSNGQRIVSVFNNHWVALDHGNKEFATYWAKHTLEDIAFKEWAADGVMIDEVGLCNDWHLNNVTSEVPAKYSDCQSWNRDLMDFLVGVSAALQQNNQQVMVNIGSTSQEASIPEAWQELSQRSSAPNIMLEEGAFAVSWGAGAVRYYPVKRWQQQIDLPSRVSRDVAMISSTDLASGQQGVSSTGEAVYHSEIMRFAVGSYLLARNASGPTTYFLFDDNIQNGITNYTEFKSANIYDKFDVGVPVTKYEKKLPDQDLFFRKYSRGYVYVNPGTTTIRAIKAESDAEFSTKYANARKDGSDWYFDLQPHDAAILRVKEGTPPPSKQSTPPIPPVLRMN